MNTEQQYTTYTAQSAQLANTGQQSSHEITFTRQSKIGRWNWNPFCKYLTFSGFIMWIYWQNWKLNDPFEITFQLLVMDDNDLKIYGVLPLSGREKWDCSIWDDLTPVTGLSEERERHQPGLIITSKTGTRIRQSCDWLLSSQDLPSSSLAIIRDPVAGRTWENGSQTRHTKSLCLA